MLLVAGASGAGKSAFIEELAAGRLPADLLSHLPSDAQRWPSMWCHLPDEWDALLDATDGATRPQGVVVHHDITLKWGGLPRPA